MLTFNYLNRDMFKDSNSITDKIISIVQNNGIVIFDGRLKSTEEALLIRESMNAISENLKFSGIEFGVMFNQSDNKNFRTMINEKFFGHKNGLTLIGPANIIKELKQHPDRIEMHFKK